MGWEADSRYVDINTETLGLRRADGTKTLRSRGTKRSIDEVKSAMDLSVDHTRTYGSVCMIINYLAQDRPDILFATKGVVTEMSPPNTMAWEMAKRCGRYSSRERCRDSRRTIQLTPSRCRLRPCRVLEDAKVHRRHRSISREARVKGSIHDTGGDRSDERRVRVLRFCVWHSHSGGIQGHDQRLRTCGQGCT